MGDSHLEVLFWAITVEILCILLKKNGFGRYDFRCTVVNGLVIDEFLLIGSDGLVNVELLLFSYCCVVDDGWSCNELFCMNFLPCSRPNPLHQLGSAWDDALHSPWATGSMSSTVSD